MVTKDSESWNASKMDKSLSEILSAKKMDNNPSGIPNVTKPVTKITKSPNVKKSVIELETNLSESQNVTKIFIRSSESLISSIAGQSVSMAKQTPMQAQLKERNVQASGQDQTLKGSMSEVNKTSKGSKCIKFQEEEK